MHRDHGGKSLALLAALSAMLLAAGWGFAQPVGWQTLTCADPPFSISAPAGWTLTPVPGKGARLVGPAGAPLVEVVAWPALRPPATAEQAAREHEALLVRAMDYTAGDRQTIRTDAGDEALMVSGLAQARGLTEASVFCAYGRGDTHWVVGAFCALDELGVLRVELLDGMMRSFRPGAQVSVPQPPVPVEPVVTVEPIVTVEPVVQDITAAPVEPTVASPNGEERPPGNTHVIGDTEPLAPDNGTQDLPWREVVGEGGYSVMLPVDWSVAVTDGRVVASWNPDPARRRAVVWWPVAGRGEMPDGDLRGMVRGLPHLDDLLVLTEVARREGMVVMRGSTGDGIGLLASYAWEADSGLLSAAIAPAGELPALEPQLARIAAGWRPNGWTVSAPGANVDFLGGLITWQLPAGWQARGGTRIVDGALVLDLEAVLEGPRKMRLAWRQPLRPAFRSLTALLESLGWREGEAYADTGGQSGLIVYRRRDPRRFLEDYLLPAHPRKLSNPVIEPREPDSAIAGLLAGTDTRGQAIVVRGESGAEACQRLYLVATGLAPPPLVSTCWEAAELRADAPDGHLPEAVAALALMVNTAQPTRDGEHSVALSDLIGRARRALRGVPPELAQGAVPGAGAGEQWRLPAGALQYWVDRAGVTDN